MRTVLTKTDISDSNANETAIPIPSYLDDRRCWSL